MKNKTLNEYLARLPKERQQKIEARAQKIREEELTLRELRKALRCSQETVGEILGVKQAEVSKMERRTDMYLSTLRRYVEAMGGHLNLVACFPNLQSVRIKELSSIKLEEEEPDAVPRLSNRKKKAAVGVKSRRR